MAGRPPAPDGLRTSGGKSVSERKRPWGGEARRGRRKWTRRCLDTSPPATSHKPWRTLPASMPLDPGTVHRFAMLERAVKSFAKTGRFDESLKLIEEMLEIAPEDAGLSKLKVRVATEMVHQAIQAQKIGAATQIVGLVETKIPAAHLGQTERELLAKAKENLYSM